MKVIKFTPSLIPLVLSGSKTATWRFFDEKDVKEGDELLFANKETGESFARAVVISVREKRFGDINETDFNGHERFESKEKMYETYRGYYGDRVSPDSVVKIINFKLL